MPCFSHEKPLQEKASQKNYNIRKQAHSICYFLFLFLVFNSNFSFAGHPGEAKSGMTHPSEPLAEGVETPYIAAELLPDIMDGFNLILDIQNFNILPPLEKTPDSLSFGNKKVMQGHVHLYLNGEKKMRVYSNSVHIPTSWLKSGINSLSASINNHMHGTFTYKDNEIQTTILFDSNIEGSGFIKNKYSWPKKSL